MITNPRLDAFSRLLQLAFRNLTRPVIYSLAILGTSALIPGINLPDSVRLAATTLGVNLLSSMLDRMAHSTIGDQDLLDQIRQVFITGQAQPEPQRRDLLTTASALRSHEARSQANDEDTQLRLRRLENIMAGVLLTATQEDMPQLPLNEQGRDRLNRIKEKVTPWLERLSDAEFADYGLLHATLTLANLDALMDCAPATIAGGPHPAEQPLTPTEAFILAAAALLHDVGLTPIISPGQPAAWLKAHWAEAGAQAVLARAGELGLAQDDPVELVAAVIQGLPLEGAPAVAEVASFQGQAVRLRWLVDLLRLAASLEVGGQADSLAPGAKDTQSVESELRRWMRGYLQAVQVQRGQVEVALQAPSESYRLPLVNAYYDFYLRRWQELADPFYRRGWLVVFRRPSFQVIESLPALPPDLWALAQDRDRFAQKLAAGHDVLGGEKEAAEPAGGVDLWPYFLDVVERPGWLAWKMEIPGVQSYQVKLGRADTGQALWKVKNASLLPAQQKQTLGISTNWEAVALPGEVELTPGVAYRWSVEAVGKLAVLKALSGDFWIATPQQVALARQAEAQAAGLPDAERQFTLGNMYRSQGRYGQAARAFRQAAGGHGAMAELAHRSLASLYNELETRLFATGRPEMAQMVHDLAQELSRQ